MEEAKRKMIRDAWFARGGATKSEFVRNQEKAGFNRRTVYNTIKRIEKDISMDRKPGGGRKIQGWTESKEMKLRHEADHTVGVSCRRLGRKFKIDHKTVKKILDRNKIEVRKRIKGPKVSEKQGNVIKTRVRNMTRGPFKASNDDIDVIMDDETYFDENGMDFSGSNTYMSSTPGEEPPSIKVKQKTKYPFKLLLWVAISKKGRSSFFVKKSRMAVNSKMYIEECLKKKLLPFIKKHYPNGDYIFWPDLASSHYSKETQNFMREHEINFVEKHLNPPNCPNLRPIESFWAKVKREVYAEGWVPKNIEELEERVKSVMRKQRFRDCESMMANVAKKVRLADRKGSMYNL